MSINEIELNDIQQSKLKEIINFSYNNIDFYKSKLLQKNINLNNKINLSDLPFTTKDELQFHNIETLTFSNMDISNCIIRKTSGSTGKPLHIYVDRRAASIDRAVWLRALLLNGLSLFDKVAVLPNPDNVYRENWWFQKFRIFRRKYINVLDEFEKQINDLKNYKPDIIRSYPSHLLVLKDHIKEGDVNPRSVFTSAELLDKRSRDTIESMFSSELFDYYATEEFNLIAWECKEHDGYHVNSDNIVLEIVKDDVCVSPGEEGEIVLTSLNNHFMPLIRYQIGDIGVLKEESCSCGISLPLLEIIEGRKDDFLTAMNGRLVSPRSLSDVFQFPSAKYEGIKQFQIVQERSDLINVFLVFNEKDLEHDRTIEIVEHKIKEILGSEMRVSFKIVDSLKKEHTGKTRKIISKMNK